MTDCELCEKRVAAAKAPLMIKDAEFNHDLCGVCGKTRGEVTDEVLRRRMLERDEPT